MDNTGNIGMIRIISESSVAAGIRRIEAITGTAVEDALDDMKRTVGEISGMLNNAPDVVAALKRSIAENADLHKQVEEYFNERVAALTADVIAKAQNIAGVKVVSLRGVRAAEMAKGVAFGVRAASPEATLFIGATVDVAGKPLLTVMVTDDLVARGFNASKMVREAAKAINGGGGGQPGFAQAGGKNKDGINAAYYILLATVK